MPHLPLGNIVFSCFPRVTPHSRWFSHCNRRMYPADQTISNIYQASFAMRACVTSPQCTPTQQDLDSGCTSGGSGFCSPLFGQGLHCFLPGSPVAGNVRNRTLMLDKLSGRSWNIIELHIYANIQLFHARRRKQACMCCCQIACPANCLSPCTTSGSRLVCSGIKS